MSSIGPRPSRYAASVPGANTHERGGAPGRDIDFDAVANVRDLGGLPTLDGRRVAPGRLLRGAALHYASAADVTTLHERGVVLNIDLRDPSEIAYTGRGLLAADSIGFVNCSLSYDRLMERPADQAAPLVPLATRYRDYLAQGPGAIVAAIEAIAEPSNHAVLVNCFFGKDRTGTLIALVLEALGVEREAIVEDYARSAIAVQTLLERLAQDPIYAETIARTDPSRLAADRQTMVDFLATLDERDDGAIAWLARAGLSTRALARLRDALLEA